MIGMRPAITSFTVTAAPAACTNEMLAFERSRNSSPVRCAWPPRLVAPNSMPPCVLLASAISSATLLAGHVLVDADRDRLLADHADRRERLHQVERHLAFLLDRQDVEGRGLRHVEAVAVLLDGGGGLRRDQSAGAGAVEHHGLLLPHLRKLVGDDAPDHVGAVAGGGRRDEGDRLARIILRLRRQRRATIATAAAHQSPILESMTFLPLRFRGCLFGDVV